MLKRSITGLGLIFIISASIYFSSYSFLFLILLLNHLGLIEYNRLLSQTGIHPQKLTPHFISMLSIALVWMTAAQIVTTEFLLSLLPLLSLPLILELFRNKPTPFQNAVLTTGGVLWISLHLASFIAMAYFPFHLHRYHPSIAMGYFIILWSGDSLAYAVGKRLGRHKLFPHISPNKTWEGSVGGLLSALLAGRLDAQFFPIFSTEKWIFLALLVNITGTFGDFVKSMLKRSAGVKDSGKILPGHGGILDRFDSLIGSAPFAFVYLYYYA